jgi:mannose/fructose/sorbose-specific phosphotransferase system IIC component
LQYLKSFIKYNLKGGGFMSISSVQMVLIFIVACISGMGSILDEFQTHRPLVACTLIGLILGDIKTGIIIGGTLEMMALGWMNIGAAVAPDTAMASIISTILVIGAKQSIGTGIAVAIPLAAAGQMLTIFARTITIGFQHKADTYAKNGNLRGIDFMHLSCLLIQAARVAIPSMLVAVFIGTSAVQSFLDAIPKVITGGLQVAGGFIVVVGYAMVINMMGARYLMGFFFLGFVVAAFTKFNLIAFGIIGVVFAIIYVQLNPKYNMPKIVTVSDHSLSDDELDDELDD